MGEGSPVSAPREALRRLREAHAECEGDFCTMDKETLLALLEVAEAALDNPCVNCPPWGYLPECDRMRAALARLGETR